MKKSHKQAMQSVNETYAQLPAWTHSLVVSVSGLAPDSYQSSTRLSSTVIKGQVTALFFGSLVCAFMLFPMLNWFGKLCVTLINLVLVTGAARAYMTTVLHDLVHCIASRKTFNYSKKKTWWLLLQANAISKLLMSQSFLGYYRDHMTHHSGRVFCKKHDPDNVALRSWNLQPLMLPSQGYWSQFLMILFSLRYHLVSTKRRLDQNCAKGSNANKVWGLFWLVSVLVLLPWLTSLAASFLLVVLPVFFGVQVAALCQFCSEHRWL